MKGTEAMGPLPRNNVETTPSSAETRCLSPQKRLLVAEDDEALRSLIADTLRADGYQVMEVRHGLELLEVLEPAMFEGQHDVQPDLIISDYHMPGCTGMSILAGIHSTGLNIPFIVITAFGDEATHTKARNLGAVAVLNKPFALNDLRTAVLSYLRA
jgi:CheY-like chemotaxis protein